MSGAPNTASREDVLAAFAVEQHVSGATLERYLRDFPQFAAELVDLSRELSRIIQEEAGPISEADNARIDAAWQRHVAAAPATLGDPLSSLSVGELRQIAQTLGVPRQIITAFRERRVIISSVPRPFLARFAAAANKTLEQFVDSLSAPSEMSAAPSYKADVKPDTQGQIAFEQLLIEAGVTDDSRATLMADGE
ncbi:MAG: hypothetical protein ABL889_16580 [Terricaulis sp.]